MSQVKDDQPPTDNEKNELFPLNCNIIELRRAFATFNYGQEKDSDGMGFMESHASLFHTICSIIKSFKKSSEHDQIQKPRQICQEVSQDDNAMEEDQISAKSTEESQVLIKDMHEGQVLGKDRQEGPVLAEDGQVGPVLAEDGQRDPVLAEDGQEHPVLVEDGQVGPVLAEDVQVGSVLAEDKQVDPVLAEDGQEHPVLVEDGQAGPILAEDVQGGPILDENVQVGPVLDEDGQVGPVLTKDGQIVPVLAKDEQVGPVLAEDGQTGPVLTEDQQLGPVLTEDQQVDPVLIEDQQVDPVLAEDGEVGPVLAEDGEVGPVLAEDGQGIPVIAGDTQEYPVFAKEGQECPVSAEEGQEGSVLAKEDPILAEVTQKDNDVCKTIHSKQQLASKCKSIVAEKQQILRCEKLSPAQMIPYVILINRSIPLPSSIIQSLCFAKKILCRIQCFTLRRKKKKLLPQPVSAKQTTLKVETDQDFVTFGSLKNLQWKLYKGIVKRKPKTTVSWRKFNYNIDWTPAACPRDAVNILPLLPKDWIIDESLKFPLPSLFHLYQAGRTSKRTSGKKLR